MFCIESVVWSHWHWDHIGDGSRFPSSVDIVVGPGFTDNFTPGWPENPECPVLQSDLEYVYFRVSYFMLWPHR